jgi:hypothetical protein
MWSPRGSTCLILILRIFLLFWKKEKNIRSIVVVMLNNDKQVKLVFNCSFIHSEIISKFYTSEYYPSIFNCFTSHVAIKSDYQRLDSQSDYWSFFNKALYWAMLHLYLQQPGIIKMFLLCNIPGKVPLFFLQLAVTKVDLTCCDVIWLWRHIFSMIYITRWLIDYVPLKNFSLKYGDVTIAGEALQSLGLCSALRAFEQRGIFIVPHLLWHGTSVFPVSSEWPPQSAASYDTRGDAEDLF